MTESPRRAPLVRRGRRAALAAALAATTGAGLAVATAPAALADDAGCLPAGPSGLTASIVAHTGQHLAGALDAAGCDVGVYVGPGVTRVRIDGMSIANAGDHGILVQDTGGVVIANSSVTGSMGLHSDVNGGPLSEDKGIALLGTHDVLVIGNHVFGNADGGIAVNDDGPVPASALSTPGTAAVPAVRNTVSGNTVEDNGAGCGIVLSAYNAATPVADNLVVGNSVHRNTAGIVVATDGPGSVATGNRVIHNVSTDNVLPGVVVHSNTPGDALSGTAVVANELSGNGEGAAAHGFPAAGIWVSGEVEQVADTLVAGNRISDEMWGVWQNNAPATRYAGNSYDGVSEQVHVTP